MTEKVTIQQIADVAGVSKFAVSRALSGKSGVSTQTRDMILRAAGQLGYFHAKPANAAASELTNGLSEEEIKGTIVVLFPNIRYQNKDSVYWGPVFDGVSRQLNRRGMDVITITEPSGDTMFTVLNPNAIKGMITLGNISTQVLLEIKRLEIPLVMIDHYDPAYLCDSVYTDNFTCMRELVMKLVGKGFKRMQFVGNIHDAQSFFERWLAYRSVVEEHKLPVQQVARLTEVAVLHDVIKAIEELPEDVLPEVFVCANDITATAVIEALENRGISVPGDCFVSGFDDTHPEMKPSLTTVKVDKEQLGIRAVDRMLWRVSNPSAQVEKTLIFADVVMRDSTLR